MSRLVAVVDKEVTCSIDSIDRLVASWYGDPSW